MTITNFITKTLQHIEKIYAEKQVIQRQTKERIDDHTIAQTYCRIAYNCIGQAIEELPDLQIAKSINPRNRFKYEFNVVAGVCGISFTIHTPTVKEIDSNTILTEQQVLQEVLDSIILDNAIEILSALKTSRLPRIIIDIITHRRNILQIKMICGSETAIASFYTNIEAQRPIGEPYDSDF